uniref:Uncharacterized protein n=1 Tax=Chlamydomonas leiostraca TaxID=1034604 RepID=A0A7S0WSP5_9CHLO|mmetsp:Transcript_26792/g.68238  ORF Transcript_26792/g.68238 Transcript_26792/m.68238 type:complete len:186 (+) Transcript_26792:132-689(+)|eukprot:CAMPEP_0202862210 /NCGR_PEP_ID=MMETSP1391-20130828/3334_1 /ASSEMBLY_ACC=CAM_ASM_000867 /TAXON_ID=1034604 /ORGANISM="Chlamydomonas leiostraca, Strain SAG 11-49" /LENGTH=185 /DNA_ID=CAMNT_0049541715 /DNA_START=129 /DNA_END=686 /DNA_ORIENTATION=-
MLKIKSKSGLKPQNLAAFNDDSDDDAAGYPSAASTASAAELKALGQSKAEAGAWEEALRAWQQAIASNPPPLELAALHELRAQVLMEAGSRDWEAIREAQRSVELAPHYAPALLTLARAQLNYGEPQLALNSYSRLLAVQPENEEARSELDNCRMLALQLKQKPGQRAHVGAGQAATGGGDAMAE